MGRTIHSLNSSASVDQAGGSIFAIRISPCSNGTAHVEGNDGRTYLGNVSAENERQVTLRVVGQEAVVLK